MGRMEYWDPVTQSRKPAKAGSIVDNTGLEYSPSDVKAIETEISSHKADYAYQTPTILGSQIRITKQSNTSRLYFKLDNDLVGNITISLDGGATSKPLQDFEGVQLTELEKGFVEVVAEATFFTLRPRDGGSDITTIEGTDGYFYQGVFETYDALKKRIAETTNYGGSIRSIAVYGDYVYYSGNNQTVIKANITDLTTVSTSVNYGGIIQAIAVQDDYVYYSGNIQTIIKANISNLTTVATSPNYGGTINSIVVQGDFVYYGGNITYTVIKANITDLTTVSTSVNYGGIIQAIAVQDDYVYYSGNIQTIIKANISNLTTVATSPSYGGAIQSIAIQRDYIYYGGLTTQTVIKANISDLTTVTTSPNYSGNITTIAVYGDYVYYGGVTTQTVIKANISDLTTVATSPNYGGIIRSIAIQRDYIYYGGDTTNTVIKTNTETYSDIIHYKRQDKAKTKTVVGTDGYSYKGVFETYDALNLDLAKLTGYRRVQK